MEHSEQRCNYYSPIFFQRLENLGSVLHFLVLCITCKRKKNNNTVATPIYFNIFVVEVATRCKYYNNINIINAQTLKIFGSMYMAIFCWYNILRYKNIYNK